MKPMISKLLLLSMFINSIQCFKVCLFACDISASQVIFTKRAAETLAKAGHNVTMYRIKSLLYSNVKINVDPKIRVIDVEATSDVDHRMDGIYNDHHLISLPHYDHYTQFSNIFVSSCEKLVKNVEFRNHLKSEKYDLAYAHPYDYCTPGLIHDAEIPTWIWLQTGKLHDMVAYDIGLPSPASFVPVVLADSSDKMNFQQRLNNFLARIIIPIYTPLVILNKQTALFRKYIRSDFPDLRDLANNCPLIMVNSHELYDLPQPILTKIIYVAGIGVETDKTSIIDQKFLDIFDKYDSAAIFSMGTVANSSTMPREWKNGLVKAFAKFPRTVFFVRYEGNDLTFSDNVRILDWIPQTALLKHPKLKFFITHGGYNSLQEALYAAKPLIMIPLFADQKRNAHMAENLGFAIRIRKSLVNENTLTNAITEMLTNNNKTLSAQKFSDMVKKRPFNAEETFVKWSEFLADVKDLKHLNPATIELNFIEYYNLDVIGFLTGFLLVMFSIIGKVIVTIYKAILPHRPLLSKIVSKMIQDFKETFLTKAMKYKLQ